MSINRWHAYHPIHAQISVYRRIGIVLALIILAETTVLIVSLSS